MLNRLRNAPAGNSQFSAGLKPRHLPALRLRGQDKARTFMPKHLERCHALDTEPDASVES